ncbi:MAG: YraN family protein [Acidobacteria bacterium]|nr:YraN family protein [Acidobacteriota bacterium]
MIDWLYRLGDAVRHRIRRKRWTPDLAAGRRGEDLAHRFLQRQGYVIVARNYRHPAGVGEIDLVGWEGDTLAFVEVKSRASQDFGPPDRAVGQEKRQHLERTARAYVRAAGADWSRVRFDIVSVVFDDPPRVELFRDAFAPTRTL